MKLIRILNLVILCLGLGFLNSCHILYSHLFERQAPYVDISEHPRMQHLIGHWLEIKQDAFLYQYSDTKDYALDIEGFSSSLPHSVAEYRKDPLNWQNTDYNAQHGCGPAQGYGKHNIIDIIPRGTKVYVSKILEKQTFYESFIQVIAYLDHPKYTCLPVNIYFLLKPEFGDVVIPYPSEPERTIMGSKITPYPQPNVIEYYDEN
jgi:hypothetical protein